MSLLVILDEPDRYVVRLALGPYDNRVYLVGDPETRDMVIIDAAADAPAILQAAAGWTVSAILTTHGHLDHVGAVDEVREVLDIPFRMHPADTEIAVMTPDVPLADGEQIAVGRLQLRTEHTPGHTPGSCCFVMPPQLFSGDTLFPGGPGATRWDYSSFPQIMDSLDRRLFVLSDETMVFPGHGEGTTIGVERPHIEEWRQRGW
jgi:glyoxylase-like metal-dependent hydrolase (beta-lactamase superfamily II)